MTSIDTRPNQMCTRIGRELGIPDDVPVVCLTLDAGTINPEWIGYRLEFVGDEAPPPPDDLAYVYAEADGVGIRIWRVQIHRKGSQAYIEARTQPGWIGYTSIDLRNLDPFERTGNHQILTTGMQMLYPRSWLGTPEGPAMYPTREYWYEAYRKAQADIEARFHRVTQEAIASELGIGLRTVKTYIAKYGRPE